MFGADCIRLLRKLRLRSTAWLLENCTEEWNVIQQGCTPHSFYKPTAKHSTGLWHTFIPLSYKPLHAIPILHLTYNLHAVLHIRTSWWVLLFPKPSVDQLPSQAGGWLSSQTHLPFINWTVEKVWLVLGHICIAQEHIASPQQCSIKPQLLSPAESLIFSRQAEHYRSSAHKAKMAPPQSMGLPRMDGQMANP